MKKNLRNPIPKYLLNDVLNFAAHLTQIIIKWLTCILIFLFGFTYSSKNQASHILGGEVSFECIGGGNYVFTLVVYRDCSGTFPFNNQIVILQNDAGVGAISCNRLIWER